MARRHQRVIWLVGVTASVIVALAANTIWVDSQTRPASARDGGAIIDTSIVPTNVKVEGEGPAILLIHGFGAAIDWWDEIAPALAVHHQVIRLDLIGHGGTEAPASGYSIPRQALLASEVLDKLAVNRVTVIGHSMGGEVTVALAELRPERIEQLILIDSPPIVGTTFSFMAEAYFTPILGEALSHLRSDKAIRRGLAQGFAPQFAFPEKFVADIKQLTYTAFQKAHRESIAFRTAKAPYERISGIKPTPPLLTIFGSLDAIVPPESAKFFGRVPGAKVAIIEGSGHSPMVEMPTKTLQLIEDFLK